MKEGWIRDIGMGLTLPKLHLATCNDDNKHKKNDNDNNNLLLITIFHQAPLLCSILIFLTRRPFCGLWGITALSLHCVCPSGLTLNKMLNGQNLLFGY